MPEERFTVRLTDEQARWVENEAERRDRSRAYIIREVVDLARGAESTDDDASRSAATRTEPDRSDAHRSAPDRPAPDDETAEPAVTEAATESGSTSDSPPETEAAVIERLVDEVASEWGDRGARLEARRDAAAAALRLLAQEGQISKQLAIDTLLPGYEIEGQSRETWWRQNCRDVVRSVATYSRGAHAYILDSGSPLANVDVDVDGGGDGDSDGDGET